MESLKGLRVAILVADGFEQIEMVKPREALDSAGADTNLVSPNKEWVRGWNFKEWGDQFAVDVALEEASSKHFDALLLTFRPSIAR